MWQICVYVVEGEEVAQFFRAILVERPLRTRRF